MKKTPNLLQAWTTAIRLRTLPIPTIQVVTGTCLAYSSVDSIHWLIVFYTWIIAVFVTIGTNLINDVIDFEKGADLPGRVGFLKVISLGLISKESIHYAGIASFILAIALSVPLAFAAGWGLFLLVFLSVICGYCYTGGPYPISYLGLSEFFILIFYGGVCVGVSYYVQTGFFGLQVLLCATQMGLFAILPNALNNFRDMQDDAEDGKLTLAVRFGKTFARCEIALLTLLPFIMGILWIAFGYIQAALLPMCLLPIAFLFVRSIWMIDPGQLFNRLFIFSIFLHFFFGLFLVIGFFLKT